MDVVLSVSHVLHLREKLLSDLSQIVVGFFVETSKKFVGVLFFLFLWCLGLWQGSLEASLGVGWGGLWDGLGSLLDVRFWLVVDATIALAGFALSSSLCELSFPLKETL